MRSVPAHNSTNNGDATPTDIVVQMGVLVGDVNGNGTVTNGDVASTQGKVGGASNSQFPIGC